MAEVLQQKKSAYPNLLYPVSRFRTGDQRWVAATFQYHGEAGLLRKLFVLDEMRDREAFLDQKKKTRRDRQKDEQATLPRSPKPVKPVEPDATQTSAAATPSEPDLEIPQFEIWDFDED